jgi:hypothetical protein
MCDCKAAGVYAKQGPLELSDLWKTGDETIKQYVYIYTYICVYVCMYVCMCIYSMAQYSSIEQNLIHGCFEKSNACFR